MEYEHSDIVVRGFHLEGFLMWEWAFAHRGYRSAIPTLSGCSDESALEHALISNASVTHVTHAGACCGHFPVGRGSSFDERVGAICLDFTLGHIAFGEDRRHGPANRPLAR